MPRFRHPVWNFGTATNVQRIALLELLLNCEASRLQVWAPAPFLLRSLHLGYMHINASTGVLEAANVQLPTHLQVQVVCLSLLLPWRPMVVSKRVLCTASHYSMRACILIGIALCRRYGQLLWRCRTHHPLRQPG